MYGALSATYFCGRGDDARADAEDVLAGELGLEALRLGRAAHHREHAVGGGLVGVGLGRDLVGARAGSVDLHELDLAAVQLVVAL